MQDNNWGVILLILVGGVLGAACGALLTFILFALGDSIFAVGRM